MFVATENVVRKYMMKLGIMLMETGIVKEYK